MMITNAAAEFSIEIYTDGSTTTNPGKGGWGYYIPYFEIEHSGHQPEATNNQMELKAVLEALNWVISTGIVSKVTIFSDSQYVVNGYMKWSKGWKAKGWSKKGSTPEECELKNKDLWIQIDRARRSNIELAWVRGHNGNLGNERADRLAYAAARAKVYV